VLYKRKNRKIRKKSKEDGLGVLREKGSNNNKEKKDKKRTH
jgi:hypothetical protein